MFIGDPGPFGWLTAMMRDDRTPEEKRAAEAAARRQNRIFVAAFAVGVFAVIAVLGGIFYAGYLLGAGQ